MYRSASLFFIVIACTFSKVKAQKVDSIFVHLYTDSLKKGTYNYINIDGLLSNGRYIPLDSSEISFSASHGKFFGNNLWLEPDCKEEKISIQAVLKKNSSLRKSFVVYVKKAANDQPLKTEKEILESMKRKNKNGR